MHILNLKPMRTILYNIIGLLFFFATPLLFSQEKDDNKQALLALLESKEFVFVPQSAIPQGMRTVQLSSSNNFLKVHPTTMQAQLPYFGRAFSADPYGGNDGIEFNTAPTDYKLNKNKKNYEITATVRAEKDIYKLTLNVGFDSHATLSVSSNKRTSIIYHGTVSPPDSSPEPGE